jgi:predicted nucleic acid-binding Zn ribbon protein
MANDLMFWGFVVFALLVVGLVLTVREFRNLE